MLSLSVKNAFLQRARPRVDALFGEIPSDVNRIQGMSNHLNKKGSARQKRGNETSYCEKGSDERADVYQIVTDRVIELLESGVVPWHKPWAAGSQEPMNLVSQKAYRGVNVWLLACSGYSSPYWVSYKQAQELGGNVKKGEKSTLVVFWKQLKVADKENPGETKTIPMLRYYRVFNVSQCEGIEYPQPEARTPEFSPIDACERVVSGMRNPPAITSTSQRACYSRRDDTVNMPDRATFDAEAQFYSTLFHELTHATGHESRLGRLQDANSHFGSSTYAKEELIAEMGAAYLCATAGVVNATINNSAAYIASWLEKLKNDTKLVVAAAGAAQKSSDYILHRERPV